jgi:prepilin-type N-terminal cleavage/methylation domain-containing protein
MTLSNKATKGFTLLELLIVILIVALIYLLGFGTVEWKQQPEKTVTPLTLKEAIQKAPYFQGYGKVICFQKPFICYYQSTISKPLTLIDSKIDLGTNIQIYKLDRDNRLSKIDFGRLNDKPISLEIDFYPNGGSTKFILQNNQNIYFIDGYFNHSQQVNSLNEAKKIWLGNTKAIEYGEFY